MTDKELLELAAKAVGYKYEKYSPAGLMTSHAEYGDDSYTWKYWNPLTDDGDALRLAVSLNIPIFPYECETSTGTIGVVAKNWGSKFENTRRAIVRAAAEIGLTQDKAR